MSFRFPAFPISFSHLLGGYWQELTCGVILSVSLVLLRDVACASVRKTQSVVSLNWTERANCNDMQRATCCHRPFGPSSFPRPCSNLAEQL